MGASLADGSADGRCGSVGVGGVPFSLAEPSPESNFKSPQMPLGLAQGRFDWRAAVAGEAGTDVAATSFFCTSLTLGSSPSESTASAANEV